MSKYSPLEQQAAAEVDAKFGVWKEDEDFTHDNQPRCTAKSNRSGERCKRARTPGTTVCATHGSSLPQVRRRARLRLLELVDPAIAKLGRVLATTADDRVALKAVEMILDRAGMPAKQAIDVEDSREVLVDRLKALQRKKAEEEIEDAEVVEEEINDVTDQLDDPTREEPQEEN